MVLMLLSKFQNQVGDIYSSNFVAFSENLNFNIRENCFVFLIFVALSENMNFNMKHTAE